MNILRLLALLATAALVALGVWVTGGLISDDFRVSMGLTAAWLAICAAGCAVVAWRVRPLRVPVLLGYALSATAIGLYLGATTLRERVVDERVVTGAPAIAAAWHLTRASATRARPTPVPCRSGTTAMFLSSISPYPVVSTSWR